MRFKMQAESWKCKLLGNLHVKIYMMFSVTRDNSLHRGGKIKRTSYFLSWKTIWNAKTIFSEYLSSPFFHPPSFSTALRIPFAPLFLGRGNKLTFGKYVSVNSTRSNRIENVKNLDILPRWIFTSFLDIRSHLSCSTQSKTNRFDVNRLSLSFPPLFFSSRLKSNHFRNFISINISLYSGFFLISKKKKKKENNNKMNEILRGKKKLISLRISLVINL